MRVEPSVRNIIDTAANLMKVDRTVFIQQAALTQARQVIAEQTDFFLADDAYAAFENALNAPAVEHQGLAELVNKKSPWE